MSKARYTIASITTSDEEIVKRCERIYKANKLTQEEIYLLGINLLDKKVKVTLPHQGANINPM